MTKHEYTPAPWSVSCSPLLGVKVYKPIREGFGQGICRVQESCHRNNPLNEEVLANARLIAAAPELLEALEQAYSHMTFNSSLDTPEIVLRGDVLNIIKLAITKALGKEYSHD